MERLLYGDLVAWRQQQERKPLILDGARQTGKTWLLRRFGEREFRRAHYINFEADPSAMSIFDGALSPQTLLPLIELYTGRAVDQEHDLIILDEIQLCPRAMTSLKYFAEEGPRYAVCCAGSLIGLSGSEGSYPVGKVSSRSLFPMSFGEYLGAADPPLHQRFMEFVRSPEPLAELVHQKLLTRMLEFFVVGGMPEAVGVFVRTGTLSADATSELTRIHRDLVTGYRSDFAKHAGTVNAQHLSRVFDSVPSQLSRDVDGNAGRFRFKGVLPDSRRYRDLAGAIDWLSTTGLVHRSSVIESPVLPLRAHARESIFKLYLLDIGLLHTMLHVPPFDIVGESWGSYRGYAAENFTAVELRAGGVDELYTWHGPTSEVEFLINVDGLTVPIEVKSGARTRRAKSLAAYRDKYRPEISVKAGPWNFRRVDGLVHLPLYAVGALPDIVGRLAGR